MPTKIQDKCRQCSKLSVENAIALHGTEGDGCWVGELCHKRRTYYKKRDLYNVEIEMDRDPKPFRSSNFITIVQ